MSANPPESYGRRRRPWGRRHRLVIAPVFFPNWPAEVAALELLLGLSYGTEPPSPPARSDRGPTPGPARGGDEPGPAEYHTVQRADPPAGRRPSAGAAVSLAAGTPVAILE